jgi:hypothetical protein
MDEGTRRRLVAHLFRHGIAAIVTGWGAAAGQAADAPRERGRVEIVHLADAPVRVVHGAGMLSVRREIVSFGNGIARPVMVVRGTDERVKEAASATPPPAIRHTTAERIAFAGAAQTTVTVVRGSAATAAPFPAAPSAPASALEFDLIAHAVHGAESSHGADPNMWRPDPDGPQGPMQVSAAAAHDTGGGNRFDVEQNRLLGRGYLARMFRRYGNWPEALAAYNWGPGNVDRWIAGGRNAERMPRETTRYIDRVLRDARIARVAGAGRLPITQ